MKEKIKGDINKLPPILQKVIYKTYRILSDISTKFHTLHQNIVSQRYLITKNTPASDPLTAQPPLELPNIDITIVTYNNGKWIKGFTESLLKQNYPLSKIFIYFVDNNSTDDTLDILTKETKKLIDNGCEINITKSNHNNVFGAGHNLAIKAGTSPFCLISNFYFFILLILVEVLKNGINNFNNFMLIN